MFSPSTVAEEASPSPSGLCWTTSGSRVEKGAQTGSAEVSPSHATFVVSRFQAGRLSGWWRGAGGDEADFVNHEHKSLLLPLRSSPPPPPPPPLPECLGLSGLLCTQIVLVRWEFIMWCGGRDQCSPVQLTGCARPRQAEGEKKYFRTKTSLQTKPQSSPSAV